MTSKILRTSNASRPPFWRLVAILLLAFAVAAPLPAVAIGDGANSTFPPQAARDSLPNAISGFLASGILPAGSVVWTDAPSLSLPGNAEVAGVLLILPSETSRTFTLSVQGDLTVSGTILAYSPAYEAPSGGKLFPKAPDGVSLDLHASNEILVSSSGVVAAGGGANGLGVVLDGAHRVAHGQDAGKGGDIALHAPVLQIEGKLKPGRGGQGGLARAGLGADAAGGRGGDAGMASANDKPMHAEAAAVGDGGNATATGWCQACHFPAPDAPHYYLPPLVPSLEKTVDDVVGGIGTGQPPSVGTDCPRTTSFEVCVSNLCPSSGVCGYGVPDAGAYVDYAIAVAGAAGGSALAYVLGQPSPCSDSSCAPPPPTGPPGACPQGAFTCVPLPCYSCPVPIGSVTPGWITTSGGGIFITCSVSHGAISCYRNQNGGSGGGSGCQPSLVCSYIPSCVQSHDAVTSTVGDLACGEITCLLADTCPIPCMGSQPCPTPCTDTTCYGICPDVCGTDILAPLQGDYGVPAAPVGIDDGYNLVYGLGIHPLCGVVDSLTVSVAGGSCNYQSDSCQGEKVGKNGDPGRQISSGKAGESVGNDCPTASSGKNGTDGSRIAVGPLNLCTEGTPGGPGGSGLASGNARGGDGGDSKTIEMPPKPGAGGSATSHGGNGGAGGMGGNGDAEATIPCPGGSGGNGGDGGSSGNAVGGDGGRGLGFYGPAPVYVIQSKCGGGGTASSVAGNAGAGGTGGSPGGTDGQKGAFGAQGEQTNGSSCPSARADTSGNVAAG